MRRLAFGLAVFGAMALATSGAANAQALLRNGWRVVAIAGTPVPPGVQVNMTFGRDGRVSGASGCNRYTGRAVLVGGDTLSIGPIASTRMACPPPRLETEARLLSVLQGQARWAVDASRRLTITTADGRTIVAEREVRRRRPGQR